MPTLLDERTEPDLNPRQRESAGVTRVSSYVTRLGTVGRGTVGVVLLALIWEFVPRLGLVESYFLPPLYTVLSAWFEMLKNGELADNVGASSPFLSISNQALSTVCSGGRK